VLGDQGGGVGLASPTGQSYVVQQGDTLSEIARMHNVPLDQLVQANNIPDAHVIRPGQQLIIPSGSFSGGQQFADQGGQQLGNCFIVPGSQLVGVGQTGGGQDNLSQISPNISYLACPLPANFTGRQDQGALQQQDQGALQQQDEGALQQQDQGAVQQQDQGAVQPQDQGAVQPQDQGAAPGQY
jgi:LysM repeat protein